MPVPSTTGMVTVRPDPGYNALVMVENPKPPRIAVIYTARSACR
jgi:hypothetical protein